MYVNVCIYVCTHVYDVCMYVCVRAFTLFFASHIVKASGMELQEFSCYVIEMVTRESTSSQTAAVEFTDWCTEINPDVFRSIF